MRARAAPTAAGPATFAQRTEIQKNSLRRQRLLSTLTLAPAALHTSLHKDKTANTSGTNHGICSGKFLAGEVRSTISNSSDFLDIEPILVSKIWELKIFVLCTCFPARLGVAPASGKGGGGGFLIRSEPGATRRGRFLPCAGLMRRYRKRKTIPVPDPRTPQTSPPALRQGPTPLAKTAPCKLCDGYEQFRAAR